MGEEIDKPTVEFFQKEVQNPERSDEIVETDFYALCRGMNQATEDGLTALLQEHRPQVAERVLNQV